MTPVPPTPLAYAAPAKPRSRRLIGIYVWSALVLLAGGLEMLVCLLTAGDFHTVYERPTDRALVGCQLAGGAMAMLAGAGGLLWRRLPRGTVLALQVLAAAAQVLPVRASLASIADARRRGGDWGALDVLGHQLFFLLELGVAALCLATAIYLQRRAVREAFAAKSAAPITAESA